MTGIKAIDQPGRMSLGLGSVSVESLKMDNDTKRGPEELPKLPRPLSTATATMFRQNTFNMLFSGETGHPVHPRHFLKEFRIAMRDLNVVDNRERIQAFEDYLTVNSPADLWYTEVVSQHLDHPTWDIFQAAFLSRFPGGTFEPGAIELSKIKCVKFRQDAAVSAFIKVTWTSDLNSTEINIGIAEKEDRNREKEQQTLKLSGYKPISTEEIFVLSEHGVPQGAKVSFSCHVWGVGEYKCDDNVWFVHDTNSSKGADFRQSGTAFKGWFNHTGKFDV